MSAQRSGLPALTDTLGQYRLHCDQVADGELPRSCVSLLMEKPCVDGPYLVRGFGMLALTPAEQLAEMEAMQDVLRDAIKKSRERASVKAH